MPPNQFDDKKANFKTLISTIGAKEVDCRVRLTIHNVSNIPVLNGAYRVRYKFRDIDSKAAKQHHKKEHDRSTAISVPTITASDADSTASRNSTSTITGLGDASSLLQGSQPPSESGVSVSPVNVSPDERGYTPYRNLRARDHTVSFDHTVEVVAHMRIVKGELIGEPLKLVVERRTEESETIGTVKKYEPRLGHKYVDLAEFVNEGKVRRKFLLDRSKTNAMILISLDISTIKGGIEFKKPPLRQDHLLIGRKEPIRPKRDNNLAFINTTAGDALKPGLSRASSSASSKSSSARSFGSKGMVPSRTETEAVIEALFNPTIFSSRPPSVLPTPTPTPNAIKFEEPLTPRPKGLQKRRPKSYCSSSGSSSPSGSPLTSRPNIDYSQLMMDAPQKKHSLPDHAKTSLAIVLDMNADKDRTIRPKALKEANTDSYEFVEFAEGSKGLKKKSTPELKSPHRANTTDSMASTRTDFSTTSTTSYPSGTASSSSKELATGSSPGDTAPSSYASFESGGYSVPSIAIVTDTPTAAEAPALPHSKHRWLKPFRKVSGDSSRPGTPTPSEGKRSLEITAAGGH